MNTSNSRSAPLKRFHAVLFGAFLGYSFLIGFQPHPASAQINAGRGPLAVGSAWNLQPGYLTASLHNRFYGKVVRFASTPSGANAVAYWDVQGGLSLNYGLGAHFDLALLAIGYQDHNQGGKGYNFLDDLFLTLKIGSMGRKGRAWRYGVNLGMRFPTAGLHNVIFEPYSAGKVSFGATGLCSYAHNPLYPEDGFSLHFNLGYWYHNDAGEKLTPLDATIDKIRVLSTTQEFTYGVGLIRPTEKFDFRWEVYGRGFIQAPPVTAYSRESVFYVCPGVSYRPNRWIRLDFSLDLRASRNVDATQYANNLRPGAIQIPGTPNYPTWRATLGMKMALLPASLRTFTERDIFVKNAESRREIYERILKEQRETEDAERELQNIREQRQKTENEIERLRRILNGEEEPGQEGKKENDKGE